MQYEFRTTQAGNVLFLILIAVTLFAALTYAITNSSRSGKTDISQEKAQLSEAVGNSCTSSVNAAVLRLSMAGKCSNSQISYEQPDGTNPNPAAPADKSCHIFHPAGGGVSPCGGYVTGDDPCMTSLAIGESCNNVIFVGISSGRRIYTTKVTSGAMPWATPPVYISTGSTNGSDGLSNTNILIARTGTGVPYTAALFCRSLGPKWYLPATSELSLMYTNRNIGELAGSFPASSHWTSSEYTTGDVFARNFSNGSGPTLYKAQSYEIRCLRRD